MCAAPRINISAPVTARADYLVQAYADVIADPPRLAALLEPLRHFRGHKVVDRWLTLLSAGAHHDLATALMVDHYDPAYATSRKAHHPVVIADLSSDRLDVAGQDDLAARIEAVISER